MIVDPFAGVNARTLPAADACLFEIARAQSRPSSIPHERRQSARFYVAVESVGRSLDAAGYPMGEPFRAVIADLSNGGLRLLHRVELTTPLLAVRIGLDSDCIVVVVRVIRSTDRQTYFEHAGPYQVPLDTDRLRDRIFELAGV